MVYESFRDISLRYKEGIINTVDTIVSYHIKELQAIILFGSCAKLNIHVGSDIDILIVTKDHITNRILKSELRDDLEELPNGLKVDVVFSTMELWKNSELRLYHDIRTEGIILWKGGKFTYDYEQLLIPCK